MAQQFDGYHSFIDPETGEEYGSFNIFKAKPDHPHLSEGWYWQAEFDGCLPDGNPQGPFNTDREAYDDAIGE